MPASDTLATQFQALDSSADPLTPLFQRIRWLGDALLRSADGLDRKIGDLGRPVDVFAGHVDRFGRPADAVGWHADRFWRPFSAIDMPPQRFDEPTDRSSRKPGDPVNESDLASRRLTEAGLRRKSQ